MGGSDTLSPPPLNGAQQTGLMCSDNTAPTAAANAANANAAAAAGLTDHMGGLSYTDSFTQYDADTDSTLHRARRAARAPLNLQTVGSFFSVLHRQTG